jgi:2-polyprenyl-3-methyl-5-hydroxy-6-metoxy-1,4-benzoquinol methylase
MVEKLPEQGNIESSVSYFETFGFERSSHVLDVGTRFGSFPCRLHDLGYENAIGIDVDAESISRGRIAYPELAQKLQHYGGAPLPFEAGQFDVVTAFDVIEHVPRAETLLRDLRRVLRPKGTFVFQTPNFFINVPKEVIYTRSLLAWRKYHCSLQTLGSLRRLLKNAGFTRIVIEKRPIYTDFNIAQSREHLGEFGPRILRVLQTLPLRIYPNFWGHAQNP